MKKLTISLMATALLLAGCSSSTSSSSIDTKISDDKTIVTVEGVKITKQDLFEKFLETYGPDQILNEALQKIADAELTEADLEEIAASVTSTLESYKTTYATYYGADFEEYVTNSLGYESVEAYGEAVVKPNLLQKQLLYKYINDNFDALMEEYGFTYVRTFSCETESDAFKAINAIDANELTFEEAAAQYGGVETAPEQVLISTLYSGSAVDSNIVSQSAKFTTVGTFSAPITTSDSKYAVVQIVSKDMSEALTDIRSQFAANEDFAIGVETKYLKQHNFEVFESTLKDGISAISDKYFAE